MPSPSQPQDQSPPDDPALREEAIGWLARLSDREATAEDRRSFEIWRAQSPGHARAYQRLAQIWDNADLNRAALLVAHTERSRAGGPVSSHGSAVEDRWVRTKWATAVSIVLLALGTVYVDLPTRLQADQQTAVGERRTVRLPDQSTVTLNTHSAIALSFDGAARTVRLLKGEAFFHVQPDSTRPFLVESAKTSTRAVGTEFVVRQQDRGDRVTVIEGTVDVSSLRNGASTERLTAGHMVEHAGGRLGTVQRIDVSTASAWRQGLLIVDDVPLASLIEELRRYYPGTIVLWNREMANRHVTGTYKLDEPSNVLYHLTKTFPLRTATLADRVVILF